MGAAAGRVAAGAAGRGRAMAGAAGAEVRRAPELREDERKAFAALLAVGAGSRTTLRCAGGWVRDKLLGRESSDIDIALDNVMGKDFAERLQEHLAGSGEPTSPVHVIQTNPDQSKHLETASMKVGALELDFVNLRSETYASDSRIPEMQFGTPKEDALRRDFTINSLFYNLNSGEVEDFCGSGLEDLRNGLIRTPLPPVQTFLDDPLRILRGVRFASRYGFELDGALVEACWDARVKEALAQKVSRERVGIEVKKMLDGPDPLNALFQLDVLQVVDVVFRAPAEVQPKLPKDYPAKCLGVAAEAKRVADELGLDLSAHERRALLLASFLLPFRGVTYAGKKKKLFPATDHIIMASLSFGKKEQADVLLLHERAADLRAACGRLDGPDARATLGMQIRGLKGLWKLALVLTTVLDLEEVAAVRKCLGKEEEGEPGAGGAGGAGGGTEQRVLACRQAMDAAEAFKVDRAWEIKPLMDGKKVMAALGVQKGGPWLGEYTKKLMVWQLGNPDADAAACAAWLKEMHSQQ